MSIDNITKRFITTASQEKAAADGCIFNERKAEHVVEFFRRFLCHSKGSDFAGRPFELLPWQRDEIVFPLFGWERPDKSRLYRKTYIEVPKKNGKSTLASGVGLYLLVGDNEPGAEVYSAATELEQASIVHGEACNMVDASPALTSILDINRSTKAIQFKSRKSVYRALSSEAASKEGLNAHAIIADELHAWKGDKLWNTLKYAFAARRNPLMFVITTAGDDPLCVCYQQHLYAKGILDGTIVDERFFAFIRAATSDDEWTAPATWLKANPSLGDKSEHPIRLDDFAHDVDEAKATPTTQETFKRYRLNVWQTAQQPWLRMEDWRACTEDFKPEEMLGKVCFGGLDLSKTRDMTAFILIFPWENETYRLLPYFWLPEDTVNDRSAPSQFREWAKLGLLETTPGNVCDYSFVEKRIAELSHDYDLLGYAYDPYNAENVTQRLDEIHGIPRQEFRQTINNFAEPTAEFERLVVSNKLHHANHPILTWQAGNVSVRTDANNNRRPIKPEFADNRKIDGIVAAIMALAMAMADETQGVSSIVY